MKKAAQHFTVSIKTPAGERGLRVKAHDALSAMRRAVPLLNIRDHEIPPGGLELYVKAQA